MQPHQGTPESSRSKRFRNDSSPFRAISPTPRDPKPVWEWKSGDGKWLKYSPEKANLLENSLCEIDRVVLPGSVEHEVDLRRFVQVNRRSGKEWNIRRRLIAAVVNPISSEVPLISRIYDGKTIFLNRLVDCRDDTRPTVNFKDVIGMSDDIESIFVTSYGTDIEWLLNHFVAGTPITLVDQPPQEVHDFSIFPLGTLWPTFQVIHPKFEKGGLFQSGTMHCKLILVKFKNGMLRICISSANLVGFDWEGITQSFWITDVETGISKRLTAVPTSTFGEDLLEFVKRLVGDNTLLKDWVSILRDYEGCISSQVPENVHLVASIPGMHGKDDLFRFGQLRVRKLLEKFQPQSVVFQMSSIGQLQIPFIESFIKSLRSSESQFHLLWPEYARAMNMAGKDHVMISEKNLAGASRFMNPLIPLAGREQALNHSKIFFGTDFVYMGSHNLSMSAWGRLMNEETSIQIASYELGILYTDVKRSDLKLTLPFDTNSCLDSSVQDPWCFEKYMKLVNCGTEALSEQEKRMICSRDGTTSFADFLSAHHGERVGLFLDDKSLPIVSEYIDKTMNRLLPIYSIESSGSLEQTNYTNHLVAFYEIKEAPCLVILGSDQGNPVLERFTGINILQAEVSGDSHEQFDKTSSMAVQFMKDHDIRLLCLDVDGTVVESNKSSVLLPAFVSFLTSLDPTKVRIALVTNQGGVGLRHWMQSGSFGDPTTLPSQEEVEGRINAIFEKISNIFINGQITKFIAFRYQSKGDESSGKAPRWGPVPFNMKEDARWKQDWRKPNPGMLNEAMKWAGISIFNKSAALMVGDMDADEGAAKAAGIKFQRAPEFFTRSIQ